MSDAAWISFWNNMPAILTGLVGVLSAIGGIVIGLLNRSKSEEHAVMLKQGQTDIKTATDGMKDAMVASARIEGAAEGKAQEQAHPTSVSVPLPEATGRRKEDA